MKVEIEIPDLEELYFCEEYESINARDVKKFIVDAAIEKFINYLYDDYISGNIRASINDRINELINQHKDTIIESVIERATTFVIAKKKVANEIPKRSELLAIDKDWEKYFIELCDKAIAKRFK